LPLPKVLIAPEPEIVVTTTTNPIRIFLNNIRDIVEEIKEQLVTPDVLPQTGAGE
jgi:hypothetical protein